MCMGSGGASRVSECSNGCLETKKQCPLESLCSTASEGVDGKSPAVAKRDLFGLPGEALVEAFRLCAGCRLWKA